MSTPTFKRARNDEQRSERRDAILEVAARMLDEVRVGDLSLNELARRAGLAKSNVLRYFQTREAVLLELYSREYDAWLDDLERRLDGRNENIELVAQAVALSAASRPRFCELCSASASVLERNVSGDAAASYKGASILQAERLSELVGTGADLNDPRALIVIGGVNLAIAGLWSAGQPSAGMIEAYRTHPELRPLQVDFTIALRELVATLLAGLERRTPRV